MSHLLVSVGTDGVTDWVKLPTGERLNLGALSIERFLTAVAGRSVGKRLVEAFLKDGEVLVRADEAQMWSVLTPTRARWASGDGPFMGADPRTTRKTMPTIHDDLTSLEQHIKALTAAAPLRASGKITAAKMEEGLAILQKFAQKIKVDDTPPTPNVIQASEGLAVDVVEANTQAAHQILAKAEETVATIDKLAALGRKFNAAKAKADVHQVTSKVASILKMDLTASWVPGDLTKLAAQTDKIHGLFAAAKV